MRAILLFSLLAVASCDPGRAELGTVRQATTEDGVADRVLGQPDLLTGTLPLSAAQSNLSAPVSIGAAPSTDSPVVWIPDRDAHRAVGWIPTASLPSYLAGQSAWTASEPKSGLIGLHSPYAVAQASAQVAIADTGNHRVLYGSLGGFPWVPNAVFGQLGSFDAATANLGGLSADSLSSPQGVAFDLTFSPRRLLVSDTGNHRVLIFTIASPPNTKAIACLGQPDCTSGLPNRGSAVSAGSLSSPRALVTWSDPKDPTNPWRGVFVADSGNHRVLHYKALDTTADFAWGQGGDFTTATASKGGPSASSLRDPTAVAVEPNGAVWIADTGHHRVLHFPKGKSVADQVLGQPDFTTVTASPEVTATTLRAPEGVAVASNGDVWVADTGHHRVVRFHKPCTESECDDGNPCTDDRCDPVTGCAHDPRTFSKACTPYRCDFASLKCQNPCTTSAPCLAPYACESGRCVLRCVVDSSCASSGRTCVDGFCCDRACTGGCESCAQPGSEGVCRTLPAGPTPALATATASHACDLPRGECGAVCDGVDALQCRLSPKGARCGVEACRDGLALLGGTCDGSGACKTATRPCAPYACAANGCHDSCVGDHQCTRDAHCVAGACVPVTELHGSGGCGFGRSSSPRGLALFMVLSLLLRRRR